MVKSAKHLKKIHKYSLLKPLSSMAFSIFLVMEEDRMHTKPFSATTHTWGLITWYTTYFSIIFSNALDKAGKTLTGLIFLTKFLFLTKFIFLKKYNVFQFNNFKKLTIFYYFIIPYLLKHSVADISFFPKYFSWDGVVFLKLGYSPCKAEEPLLRLELLRKEEQKDQEQKRKGV